LAFPRVGSRAGTDQNWPRERSAGVLTARLWIVEQVSRWNGIRGDQLGRQDEAHSVEDNRHLSGFVQRISDRILEAAARAPARRARRLRLLEAGRHLRCQRARDPTGVSVPLEVARPLPGASLKLDLKVHTSTASLMPDSVVQGRRSAFERAPGRVRHPAMQQAQIGHRQYLERGAVILAAEIVVDVFILACDLV
jgi:hypothetical protein